MNSFHFKDSLSFLNSSLQQLMENLVKDKMHKFNILDQLKLYEKNDLAKKELLLRKGIYPYEVSVINIIIIFFLTFH